MDVALRKIMISAVLLIFTCNATAHNEATAITEISLEQLLDAEVFTASKFNQKMSEAPSRVSVITSDAIRKYGYRTLKDVLNSIPGLFHTYDRNYSYLGVRGFGLPADYNTRVLMLLDGQRVNDNVYDSFGTDFDGIVNVDLIERVEFSSGPSSAIYGANAFFGVINVITKSGDAIDGLQASADYASENSRRARITSGEIFDNGVEAVFSASAYNSSGDDIFFPEFNDPTTNFGVAENLDYHRAKNLFVKLHLDNWGFEAAYNERTKGTPTAVFGQEFNLSPSQSIDTVGLAALTYDTIFNTHSELSSSLSFGRYEYIGDFIYDNPPLTVNKDDSTGEWQNLTVQYQTTHFHNHRIIVGAEYQNNSKQDQANFDVAPFFSYLDDRRDTKSYGIFFQDEIRLSEEFLLNAGVRYDKYDYDADATNVDNDIVNPRVALIYSVQPETILKFIYGTAFRNANAYELYYSDALGYLPSPNLKPEEIETYEIDVEHFVNNNFKLTTSVFSNRTDNLIGISTNTLGDIFFDNIDRVDAVGADFEIEYIADTGMMLRSSYSFVDTELGTAGAELTNSPENMAKVNLSLPVFQKKATAGFEFQYLSDRITPQGNKVGSYGITNLTLSSQSILNRLDLSASIYNLFDKEYADPVSEDYVQSSIVQDGRNFRIKATYTF